MQHTAFWKTKESLVKATNTKDEESENSRIPVRKNL